MSSSRRRKSSTTSISSIASNISDRVLDILNGTEKQSFFYDDNGYESDTSTGSEVSFNIRRKQRSNYGDISDFALLQKPKKSSRNKRSNRRLKSLESQNIPSWDDGLSAPVYDDDEPSLSYRVALENTVRPGKTNEKKLKKKRSKSSSSSVIRTRKSRPQSARIATSSPKKTRSIRKRRKRKKKTPKLTKNRAISYLRGSTRNFNDDNDNNDDNYNHGMIVVTSDKKVQHRGSIGTKSPNAPSSSISKQRGSIKKNTKTRRNSARKSSSALKSIDQSPPVSPKLESMKKKSVSFNAVPHVKPVYTEIEPIKTAMDLEDYYSEIYNEIYDLTSGYHSDSELSTSVSTMSIKDRKKKWQQVGVFKRLQQTSTASQRALYDTETGKSKRNQVQKAVRKKQSRGFIF